MGTQKFVFFSIHNCDQHPEVPLMQIKFCTENFLRDIGLNHLIIRLCGFMQVLSTPHHSCYVPSHFDAFFLSSPFVICFLSQFDAFLLSSPFVICFLCIFNWFSIPTHYTRCAADCSPFEDQSWDPHVVLRQGLARDILFTFFVPTLFL